MQFRLIHEVGNRQRWRTDTPMTRASAELIASDIEAVEGVTGVVVNPRTGSVVVTVDTLEARNGVVRYISGLADHPPIFRSGRERFVTDEARARAARLPVVRAACPSGRLGLLAEAVRSNPLVVQIREAFRSGWDDMPVLADVVRPVGRALGLVKAPAIVPDDAAPRLEFGEVARYFVINRFLPFVVTTANTVLGAVPIIFNGVKSLLHGRLDVDVLDAAAVGISILRRDWRTAGLTILLLGLGEMLDKYARKKSMNSLAEQLSIKCDSVWVRRGESLERIPIRKVTTEDVVVVRMGSVIPVDGVVVDGEAAVNQATMTGEAVAVHRAPGGTVFAGCVVEDGEVGIRPTHVGDGTRLAKIIKFVEESELAKASIESRATRIADAIVPFNFLLAGVVWLLTRNLNRTAAVLMVDYSCAIRLATPLAILSAMKEGTARGALVKGGRYLEALSKVDTVVFDKTGTLTSSQPTLSDVVPLSGDWDEDELLRLSACLEEHFPHPVSRAVVRAADERGLDHYEEQHDTEVEYVVAHGICSTVDGERVILGSRHFVEEDERVDCSTKEARAAIDRLTGEGKTVLFVVSGGRLIGLLGIDDYRSQVLPSDKADEVLKLKAAGRTVLMVGDGINDSPALSSADVGATLRDSTDIAQEVADVVLEGTLGNLLMAFDLSEATMRRIKGNMAASIGLNSVFLAGGLAGVLTPVVSALLHNTTTIFVCLNSMRPELGPYENGGGVVARIGHDLRMLACNVRSVFEGRAPDINQPACACLAGAA